MSLLFISRFPFAQSRWLAQLSLLFWCSWLWGVPLLLADELDDALEGLAKQLEEQLQPRFTQSQFSANARVAIAEIVESQSGRRWEASERLIFRLSQALSHKTNLTLLHPEVLTPLWVKHWREINQGQALQLARHISAEAGAVLSILGEFDLQSHEVTLRVQILETSHGQVYGGGKIKFSTSALPPDSWQPARLYRDLEHLSIAKALIAKNELIAALKPLQQVTSGDSAEAIEAEGWRLWISLRLGEAQPEAITTFITRYPEHALTKELTREEQQQTALRQIELALSRQEWAEAHQILKSQTPAQHSAQELERYARKIEELVLAHSRTLLKSKDWATLAAQWPQLTPMFTAQQSRLRELLQQEVTHAFGEEVENALKRKDRSQTETLLNTFGKIFITPEQQNLWQQALAKIPPPPAGMVSIPGSRFTMGNPQGKEDERPAHTLFLDGFYIDQHEVTNQQYQECVRANHCTPSLSETDEAFNSPQQPVSGVHWKQAQQYCQWKKRRLPSEAEWELAAALPSGKVALDQYAWFAPNAGGRPREVGTLAAHPAGTFDMLGNVMEWVHDWYDPEYYGWSPAKNPLGPKSGKYRVVRGGSWYHGPEVTCPTCRFYWSPALAFNYIGFRCAQSIP